MNGKIVEKMSTEEHGMMAANIAAALGAFVRQHRSGRVGVEACYHRPADPLNVRVPDLSFTGARRPLVREGSVPDLAVEIRIQRMDKVPKPNKLVDYRGRGIGGLLLRRVVEWAKEQDMASLYVWPAEESVQFYARAGFARDGEVMECLLRPNVS